MHLHWYRLDVDVKTLHRLTMCDCGNAVELVGDHLELFPDHVGHSKYSEELW
jgi:hypothetical protein